MKKAILLTALCLAVSAPVHARMIDYPGSWIVMQSNDGENNSLDALYSVSNRHSLGYQANFWRDGEWTQHSVEAAYLVHRWNESDLQANLFVSGGLGVATSDFGEFDSETEPAAFGLVEFDAENRRLYGSYQAKYTDAGGIFDGFEQRVRAGIAPYVAEYGSLHTWIMLQIDHRPWASDKDGELTWTPFLRFFKGDVMVEVGYSDSEKVLFNVMVRF